MALPMLKNVQITRKSAKSLSVADFSANHLSVGVPVVIENCIDHWPALKWTLDSLRERAGQNDVYVRSNTNCQDYRKGMKYNIRQSKFHQYLDDIKKDNSRSRNSYLAVQNVKKAFPQLEGDIEVPDYVGKVHAGPFLWIARKGHYEYCHFDPDDGMLIMLTGRKQVRLFGSQLVPMYPNKLGSHGRTVQATVDCDQPDLSLHPDFLKATCYYTDLNAGEMLYIPAFWWHQVSSLEVSISINIFFGDSGENTYLGKVMKAPWNEAFTHWLLNIVEQNRSYESFPRILARLPECLKHFLHKQWHEFASEEQLELLTELVMKHLGITKLPKDQSTSKYPPPLQIRGLLWRK